MFGNNLCGSLELISIAQEKNRPNYSCEVTCTRIKGATPGDQIQHYLVATFDYTAEQLLAKKKETVMVKEYFL